MEQARKTNLLDAKKMIQKELEALQEQESLDLMRLDIIQAKIQNKINALNDIEFLFAEDGE
jgi:hypothetical protein